MSLKSFWGLGGGGGWSPKNIESKLLFWGKYSEISGGQMPNKVSGSSDYLTVTGSENNYTYQTPNTQAYIDADTDFIWFTNSGAQRTVTTAELVGYDLQRTPVKYQNDTPNYLEEIIILKAGIVLTTSEINHLHEYMQLSIFWSGVLNEFGVIKSNRELISIPNIISVTFTNADRDSVDIKYDQEINPFSIPTNEAFSIADNTITNVSILNDTITVSLASAYLYMDVVNISYTQPVVNMIKSALSGLSAESFSNVLITNDADDRLKFTIDTTKTGSANNTFILPVNSALSYDYYLDWGDGSAVEHITVNTNQTHIYAATGSYQIKIYGTFPSFYFNTLGDRLKLITLQQWGNIKWTSFGSAFYGCSNFIGGWIDTPDLRFCNNFASAFIGTAMPNGFTNWDTSNITSFFAMFYASVVKQSFASWNVEKATNMDNMLFARDINVTGNTINYDTTLISWALQNVKSSVKFNAGDSKYGAAIVDNGTATSTIAAKLEDSTQNFLTTVTVGDVINNTTDGTFAIVTAIDSDTVLSINRNIMALGENYTIQHSDAAKSRAHLVLEHLWNITDGGVF